MIKNKFLWQEEMDKRGYGKFIHTATSSNQHQREEKLALQFNYHYSAIQRLTNKVKRMSMIAPFTSMATPNVMNLQVY
jgi:hypothetical protein